VTTRADYIEAVGELVPGDHPLAAADLEKLKIKAVAKAMDHHSRQKPQVVVEDLDGDGGFDYAVSGLASWADEFSVIRQVEYPVDDDDETPDVLQGDEWTIYEKPAGEYLRFLNDSPASTEDIRVTYTARHACTVSACTVAGGDHEAVQSLAAHFFCKMLAAAYALDQDSTIDADSVEHGGRSRKYRELAKQYLSDYDNHLGITSGKPKAASVTKDQDKTASWAGDHLTHKRRYR